MISANLAPSSDFFSDPSGGNRYVLVFDVTFPTPVPVGPGSSSDEIVFSFQRLLNNGGVTSVQSKFSSGTIEQIRIACASENYTFSLRQRAGIVDPAITRDEILRFVEADRYVDLVFDRPITFTNNDTPAAANLYAVLTNEDVANTIETLEVEIVFRTLRSLGRV